MASAGWRSLVAACFGAVPQVRSCLRRHGGSKPIANPVPTASGFIKVRYRVMVVLNNPLNPAGGNQPYDGHEPAGLDKRRSKSVNGQGNLSVPSDQRSLNVLRLDDRRVAEDDAYLQSGTAVLGTRRHPGCRLSRRLWRISASARAMKSTSANQRHPGLRNEQPKAPHW